MAIAQVGNWTSAQFDSATGGTLAGRTSTAGNFVAITASSDDGAATFSHSQAGTIQTARTWENNVDDFATIRYIENIVGGASHTITITTAAGSYSALNATEYSGLATSASLDKTNVGTGSGVNLLSAATATTAQADELLIGGGTRNDATASGGTWTAGASYTLRGNIGTVNGSVSFLEDRIVSATGTYTSSATWGATAPSTWTCQVATFKAALAGGGASVPTLLGPGSQGPLAWQWQQLIGVDAPPATAVVTWLPSNATTHRLVRLTPRTARNVVPPQFNPPLPLPPGTQPRRARGWPVRRGHQATVIPPQQNPPVPPPHPSQHRTWATLLRRGRAVATVPPQQNPIIAPPVANQSRRLRGWPVRRGHAVSPVPTQQALPTNPPFASVNDQHRLWAGWLRRGRRVSPIPPQQNPPVPPPHPTQHRTVPTLLRRGRHVTPAPLQPVPPPVVRRRPSPPTMRRGRRSGPVGYQDTPQPAQGHRAPRFWRQKPRQPQRIPTPTVVLPNPPLPTKTATIRRLAGWLLRRGRKAEQGWPQGVNLVIPDITYPTAFEVLADWHLDFDADPSGLGVELASSNLSFAADASGDTFAVDPSSQPFDLN